MPKTLTVRLSDQEAMELELLIKEHDGIKTGTKMLMHCMERYQRMQDTIKFLEEKIETLEHREAVLGKIIEDARTACALVVDKTAQKDLIAGE